MSGYHGTTLKSLETFSNFKRTHCLLQVWEAILCEMLHVYFTSISEGDVLENVKILLTSKIQDSTYEVLKSTETILNDTKMIEEFSKFIQEISDRDEKWQFWIQFVFSDCYCYIGLYLANWKLRLSSLKQMAAFDRNT